MPTPFCTPTPPQPPPTCCLVPCSPGVRQRDAALSERRYVPPPPAMPLPPGLHGHPVREGPLPGVRRGVRRPVVPGLHQSARVFPRSSPAIDCFPLLRHPAGLAYLTKILRPHLLRLNSQPQEREGQKKEKKKGGK